MSCHILINNISKSFLIKHLLTKLLTSTQNQGCRKCLDLKNFSWTHLFSLSFLFYFLPVFYFFFLHFYLFWCYESFHWRAQISIYFQFVKCWTNFARTSFAHSDIFCTPGVSIAAEICKEFNTRVLLNNYFRIPLALLPWKRLILRYTSILFLHGKVFTERSGQL